MAKQDIVWMTNRVPFVLLGAILVGIPTTLLIIPVILPETPAWAVLPGLLGVYLGFMVVVSQYLVFRIGFSEEGVVFKKFAGTIRVMKSEVEMVEVFPKYLRSDVEDPFRERKNYKMMIHLRDKRSMKFGYIELPIIDRIARTLLTD
jgi:hypothetical protein